MKIYTDKEIDSMCDGTWNVEQDNHGQVIIYTGVFFWRDGTYRDEPDPNYCDDKDGNLTENGECMLDLIFDGLTLTTSETNNEKSFSCQNHPFNFEPNCDDCQKELS